MNKDEFNNYQPKYFSLFELCYSETAIDNDILNIPTFSAVDNLKRLIRLVLDPTRSLLGSSIYVTSGYRSPLLNSFVGGVSNSQHMLGLAVDIYANDMYTLHEILAKNEHIDQLITEIGKDGFMWYHVSIAPSHAKPRQMFFNIKH